MNKGAIGYSDFNIYDADGGFIIRQGMTSTKIWIERTRDDASGEGMEMETSVLLEVIRKLYNEKF